MVLLQKPVLMGTAISEKKKTVKRQNENKRKTSTDHLPFKITWAPDKIRA